MSDIKALSIQEIDLELHKLQAEEDAIKARKKALHLERDEKARAEKVEAALKSAGVDASVVAKVLKLKADGEKV